MNLRPYQAAAIERISCAFDGGFRAPLLVMPCGAGKTVTFSHIARSAAASDLRVWVLAHRRELIRQASVKLTACGVEHGIIAPGYAWTRDAAHVGSIQTVSARLADMEPPDLLIADECHHAVSPQWARLTSLMRERGGRIVGVTATPSRLDGRALSPPFDTLIIGPSVADLISAGHLVPSRVFAPAEAVDVRAASGGGGDYQLDALEQIMDVPKLTGDAVAHYARLAPGIRAIVFCVTVRHAQDVARVFGASGWSAVAADGAMPTAERDRAFAGLASGAVQLLCVCDLASEGVDIPDVGCVIDLRPTKSLGLQTQKIGRGQRPAPGKTCLITGTRILTDMGLVPIERVTKEMRLWDGCSWVSHDGAIQRGIKDVITYAGLTATPDHEVWTEEGWQAFGVCAAKQTPISVTGNGRESIREAHNYFRGGSQGEASSHAHCMRGLRKTDVERVHKSDTRRSWMPQMCENKNCTEVAKSTLHRSQAAMRKSRPASIQALRWAWDKILIQVSKLTCSIPIVGIGNNAGYGDRQDRQQRTLRAWQHKTINAPSEHGAHTKNQAHSELPSLQKGSSGDTICGQHASGVFLKGNSGDGDNKEVLPLFTQAKGLVWDILNAGPLHRYTAEGLLVSNCLIVLDHAGNTLRHGMPDTDHEWTLEGRRKRPKTEIAVVQCPGCYAMHKPARACPECGHEYGGADKPPTRSVLQVDGDLVEMDAERIDRMRRAPLHDLLREARTRADLEEIKKSEGI